MIASLPRKSDSVLILLGLLIFILLILGVILLVRRQPQLAPQAPGALARNTLSNRARARFIRRPNPDS